jgi:hypothetical protein
MLVHRPDLPTELDQLVLKLMAKSPADRYQSAGEMLAELAKLRDVLQVGTAPTITDAGLAGRDDDVTSSRGPAAIDSVGSRSASLGSTVLSHASSFAHTASLSLARLSGRLIVAIVAACLVLGGIAGWSTRNPDVMAIPTEPATVLPVLWVCPSWSAVPRQAGAQEQLHYALFQAPREERVAACLAVPGFFPHSHEQVSRAYTQLARIWYRDCDLDSLLALEQELTGWKAAKTHEQELIEVVRIAIKLRKADFEGVLEGFKTLTRDDVSDMYDPALVELSLEICSDSLTSVVRAGAEAIVRETLQEVQTHLVRQLYRIEVPRADRLLSRAALKRT